MVKEEFKIKTDCPHCGARCFGICYDISPNIIISVDWEKVLDVLNEAHYHPVNGYLVECLKKSEIFKTGSQGD